MRRIVLGLLLTLAFTFELSADQESRDPTAPGPLAAVAAEPIQALLVTGGCCHDYARQKLILTRGISARADVIWTVAHQGGSATDSKIPLYADSDWANGFDVVVHNECFADVRDKEFVDNVLRPHRRGLPALLIHCAMHSYRTGDPRWFEFVGVESPSHGPHYPYTVEFRALDHPVLRGLGASLHVPRGELYHTVRKFESATVLGIAKRRSDGEEQASVWTNRYGDGKVFATTIGHYNEAMAEPSYLDLVTRGLLWACGVNPDTAFRATTPEINAEIRRLATVDLAEVASGPRAEAPSKPEGNLARSGTPSATSEQPNNIAEHAIDGDSRTRWCANNNDSGQSWQVGLDGAHHVRSVRLHWEAEAAYRYTVETSADGKAWRAVVDASTNQQAAQVIEHQVDARGTTHLRITYLGAKPRYWGSLREFEAYSSKELPPLSESSTDTAGRVSAMDVEAGPELTVTLYGLPPEVNYPVCLAAAPTGELFVGVDEQGSLGKKPGGGKVLRCLDTDGDGQADRINVFATMDHPRGLFFDNGSLWVLHPPLLSVYHDDNRDGVADRSEVLVTEIASDALEKRGADHTTNGIRVGIDGWIYIAVGDFGFAGAQGRDGEKLSRRGGGILRVRPDGTELEIYSWGQRNIVDVGVDPYLNLFTRDNTNDGGGWDIRLSHIVQTAEYGYPSLYTHFTEETMPPLRDFGGGSGCGGMFLHDLRWPAPFASALYTCDWGRNEVYRHNLPANGATFDSHQEVFLKIPRPTDIDIDGSGRLYVSSWKNGRFAYSGPDVGFVVQVTPANFTPRPFPNLPRSSDAELFEHLSAPSAVYRLHAQRELLRRGHSEERERKLIEIARQETTPLYGRVAAMFTLKQLAPKRSVKAFLNMMNDERVKEFVLRALTDRREGLADMPLEPFLGALGSENQRVRAQALISLARLGRPEAAARILPLTTRDPKHPAPPPKDPWRHPDPGRVVPHLAVRALVHCEAVDACLEAIDGPHAPGAFMALKYLHTKSAVDGLIAQLSRSRRASKRHEIVTTLVRLFHREGKYSGGWWGGRPDRSGPYFDRKPWEESPRIASALKTFLSSCDAETLEHAKEQLRRHKVEIEGLGGDVAKPVEPVVEKPIEIPPADPNDPNLIANLEVTQVIGRMEAVTGDASRGAALFQAQSCATCHTTADGQAPKGPHLVDIGKRYSQRELVDSILQPSAKIAQGFETYVFVKNNGDVVTGFTTGESASLIELRRADGIAMTLARQELSLREKSDESMMPVGLVGNLTPQQLADLIAYLQALD